MIRPSHDPWLTKKMPRTKYCEFMRRLIARVLRIRADINGPSEQWRRNAAGGTKWAYSQNNGLCSLLCRALLASFHQQRLRLVSAVDADDIQEDTMLRMLTNLRSTVHDGLRPARVLWKYLAPVRGRQLNHIDARKTRQQHETLAAAQRVAIEQLSALHAAINDEKYRLALAKLRGRDHALVEAVIGNGTRVSDLATAAALPERIIRGRLRKALRRLFREYRRLQPPDEP